MFEPRVCDWLRWCRVATIIHHCSETCPMKCSATSSSYVILSYYLMTKSTYRVKLSSPKSVRNGVRLRSALVRYGATSRSSTRILSKITNTTFTSTGRGLRARAHPLTVARTSFFPLADDRFGWNIVVFIPRPRPCEPRQHHRHDPCNHVLQTVLGALALLIIINGRADCFKETDFKKVLAIGVLLSRMSDCRACQPRREELEVLGVRRRACDSQRE